jgi:hypothetical protein
MTALFAYLSYRDAPAAIDWIEATGFRVVTRHSADDGRALHAELRLGSTSSLMTSTRGRPAAAVVGGDPGSGKRRLLAEVVARVDLERKLRVGGYEPERRVPFAARRRRTRVARAGADQIAQLRGALVPAGSARRKQTDLSHQSRAGGRRRRFTGRRSREGS